MMDKDPASKATANAATSADGDPHLDLKKRARRRLVGAIALALLAVIVLPMVMDQEPRPVTQEIQIRIPSQEPGANSVVSRITPKQFTPPTPLEPSGTPPQAAQPAARAEVKPDAKSEARPEAKPEGKAPAKADGKSETKPAEKTAEKAADKVADKTIEKASAKAAESARAAALLNDEQWLIQLGAYQDQGNVKLLQGKIKELGYTSFTEKVDTPQGPRIRVRCGPFPTREAAEKAQARLKKIGAGGPGGGTVAQAK